eukprot:SAG11_NODE_2050_length_3882_cov_13.229842_2_plen_111_part_00
MSPQTSIPWLDQYIYLIDPEKPDEPEKKLFLCRRQETVKIDVEPVWHTAHSLNASSLGMHDMSTRTQWARRARCTRWSHAPGVRALRALSGSRHLHRTASSRSCEPSFFV